MKRPTNPYAERRRLRGERAGTRHYELAPTVPHEGPLVFDWNQGTGEVTGPWAAMILELAKPGSDIGLHPDPSGCRLGRNPLRSRRDMAAIVGYQWRLPRDLARHYPRLRDQWKGQGPDGLCYGSTPT